MHTYIAGLGSGSIQQAAQHPLHVSIPNASHHHHHHHSNINSTRFHLHHPPPPHILLSGDLNSTMAGHELEAVMKKTGKFPFLSQDEKNTKIDVLISRQKLIPKKQREKTTDFVNWPETHAEMDLTELFAARVSLMKVLKFIKPGHSIHKFIGLFKDADAACSDAWATVIALRSLVASVPKISSYEPGLPHQLERCAILNIERAVGSLTCILLNPNYLESLRRKSTHKNQHKLTVGRVEEYTKDVKSWKCIGSMLTKEINEGNMQFVRGVLETLEARSISGKDQKEMTNQKSYLTHKEALMQIIGGRKGIDTAMRGLDQGATPVSFIQPVFRT